MKKWYQSRTIILNVIAGGIELANLLMVNPIIPKEFAGYLTIAVNVLNVILRTITKTGIESVLPPKK